MTLQIKKIHPLDNVNKERLKEFMKSIPKKDLEDIGIPKYESIGQNIFESDILRGNLVPYIAVKNNEIWGMSFRWESSAIYIPNYKQSNIEGYLNLAKISGWELLGCYTDPGRVGGGVFGTLSREIMQDVSEQQQLLYLIIRANRKLESKLKDIYSDHIIKFDEIFKKREFDFAAFVDYLIVQKVPAKEVIDLLNSHELYDKKAERLEYFWSKMVNEGKGFCVGNYFMDGAPLFVSNNF